uniref:Uncharacterized protein n=1 Tax=Setaria viridis TaxID=4556 RepID=A0A4U6THS9_SETVI|nr:hypothetical protein SEVIR_8G210400v2 [Setaria viridis]
MLRPRPRRRAATTEPPRYHATPTEPLHCHAHSNTGELRPSSAAVLLPSRPMLSCPLKDRTGELSPSSRNHGTPTGTPRHHTRASIGELCPSSNCHAKEWRGGEGLTTRSGGEGRRWTSGRELRGHTGWREGEGRRRTNGREGEGWSGGIHYRERSWRVGAVRREGRGALALTAGRGAVGEEWWGGKGEERGWGLMERMEG